MLAALGDVYQSHGDRLVFVLAAEPIPNVAEWFRKAGVEWRVISGWGEFGEAVRPWCVLMPGIRLLKEFRPDVAVMHFGNELPSLVLSLLAPLIGIRGVKWVWQQDQQIVPPRRLTCLVSRIRLLGCRFNRFAVVYEGGRDAMVARGISRGRIAVVHNGVIDPEPAINREAVRKYMDSLSVWGGCSHPAKTLLLMSVGSMIPRKRQGFLVEVFAELVREIKSPPMRLILIGDGPERPALERQVRTLGLQDHVAFLGKRNDVAWLLCGADVFVHAAVAEGCAYALSEAMAAGVPMVVTEAGAAREQVEEGGNGYVVPVQDRVMFRERLKELTQNAILRGRMGGASRTRWAAGFKVEGQARGYWRIYRELSEGSAEHV